MTAADALKNVSSLSKLAIKQAMTKGAVWLSRSNCTKRIRRFDKKLRLGDIIYLYYDSDVLTRTVNPPTLVMDENAYSIWAKPYGMLCQGSKWGDHCTINRWVEQNLRPQRPAFIVHRLDRAASGLMILAHKKKIAAYFSQLFEKRKLTKRYHALVHGRFPQSKTFNNQIEGKPAISYCEKLDYLLDEDRSYIEVSIETGRKHQIRRHLSEAGYPIVGDRLYGVSSDVADINLQLTSSYLSFLSPVDHCQKHYTLPDELRLSLP